MAGGGNGKGSLAIREGSGKTRNEARIRSDRFTSITTGTGDRRKPTLVNRGQDTGSISRGQQTNLKGLRSSGRQSRAPSARAQKSAARRAANRVPTRNIDFIRGFDKVRSGFG